MAFNYYYDFEDCFQLSGGTGTTLTYVVGSNEVLNVGDTYRIFSISNPYQISCGLNMTASTSTAATHYTGVKNVYASCNSCLTASTQIIQVSGFTNIGSNINLVGDIKYKKGDIINLDITYDLSGTKKFLKTPAIVLNTSVYTSTASTIPNLIYYVPYDSYQQVIESKGLYYLVEDCSGGTQSIILSKYEILNQNQVVSIPTYATSGDSPCVTVLTAITNGNYSQVSAVTATLNSSLTFSSCTDCLTNYQSADTDETFAQNTYDGDFIYDIKELVDGSLVLGGGGIITADDGNLYNYGNLIKLNQDGSLDLTFNPNTEGSMYLDGSTFIYANYDDKFNLENNFSIEFWIKFSSHEFNAGIISFKDSGAENGWQIRFDGNDNYLSFEYNSDTLTTNTQLNPNEWYHIAIVNNCDSNLLIIYINGNDDVSDDCSSNLVASEGTTLKIGIERTYDTYVTGLITNVRIVNGDDNFAYNGTFTPQTSPLRRTQSTYDNVNGIGENQVVLLLNFSDKNSVLIDNSVYSTKFFINKPSVINLN